MSANREDKKKDELERLAEENGLAIVVVDEDSSVVSESNNNSMCRALYSSEEFAPRCAEFCGRAFEWASKAGKPVEYECYAGLNCAAVPVKSGEKPLVAIVGRTFLKAENYRRATERAISGDWTKFPPSKFFGNVLLSGSAKNLEKVAGRIENSDKKNLIEKNKSPLSALDEENLIELPGEKTHAGAKPSGKPSASPVKPIEPEEITTWRAFFGSLLELNYHRALASVLDFVSSRYGFSSIAWLERKDDSLEVISASGKLKNQQFEISVPADDRRLVEAFRRETALELREKQTDEETKTRRTLRLFPIAVGDQIRAALVVADEIGDEDKKRHIARFCQSIASELEILRLRQEIERRNWMTNAVKKLNESMNEIDEENFWTRLVQIAVELMQAERGSILVFDEKQNALTTKSAVGARADFIKNESETLGARVARTVLGRGKPLLAINANTIGLPPAPSEYEYKSNSFICYPMNIGGRKIGVLNIADKADGDAYNEFDLELLHAIIPQFAVLIDRAVLKNRAGEFEQLSVTDALTGLLNRRYLEERLAEETKRSNRYGYPMSFMMIDVDNFKSYNDNFGHPEGDKTLQMVAHSLKETLRDADVAARYGGEEFSILLPQTTSDDALTIAERIRKNIESTEFPHREVTVSIGIASCSHIVCTPPEIIKAADKALYEAKRKGRNNVQVYENLIDRDE